MSEQIMDSESVTDPVLCHYCGEEVGRPVTVEGLGSFHAQGRLIRVKAIDGNHVWVQAASCFDRFLGGVDVGER